MNARTLVLAAAAALAAAPAHAVVIQAGIIEVAGDRATVDLIYFTQFDAGLEDIGVSPICSALCGVLSDERSGLALYTNVGGLPGAFIAGDPGDAATRASTIFDVPLAVGDYILAVSAFSTDVGDFPPFQTDPNILATISFEYEAGFSPGNLNITCLVEGNLDGTVDVTRFAGANCAFAPIPEPGGAPLLALFGLVPLAGLLRWR